MRNQDENVVKDFGNEWARYNYQTLSNQQLEASFHEYFCHFPFHKINSESVGFDMGCGSGRWARLIAPKVGLLNCIDPSPEALAQAKSNLSPFANCRFECSGVSESTLPENSQDFGYCLGVLHHIPETHEGIKACAKKLKKGAPFLIYLYYRFDNKPLWFVMLWQASDLMRKIISRLPFGVKVFVTELIAFFIYFPLSRLAKVAEKLKLKVDHFPLAVYRDKSYYFLRTDALDRFGTKLEKRFTQEEISKMLTEAGFIDIRFNQSAPYWVANAIKG